MIYHLNVLSWAGIALGASHYWGVINANYRAKEDVPSIKLDNNRMFSEKEVISAARRWFKKNAKQGDILLHGSHCSCDPQTILIGPRKLKRVGNALVKRAEALDCWEHSWNEGKMKKSL